MASIRSYVPHIISTLTLASAVTAQAQPTFTPLGLPPQAGESIGLAISGDGSVVVGATDTLNPTQADGGWVWRRGRGYSYLPWRAQDFGTGAFSVSGNGARIVGVTADVYIPTANAASWNGATGALTVLGALPGGEEERAIAYGVSRNGSTVVGTSSSALSGAEAFRVGPDGVMTGLGFFPGFEWSEAYAANADGSVVVGMGYDSLLHFSAMYWSEELGMQNLGRLPGAFTGSAYAVSDDGSVVAGECWIHDQAADNNFPHGFRWTWGTGMVELGPRPTGFVGTNAYCMTANGSLVGGTLIAVNYPFSQAMLWDDQHGCRLLSTILTNAGLGPAIQGWVLDDVAAISGDGTYILGNGYAPSGYLSPFVVHLPRPTCSPDFNHDGDVGTDLDIEAFFACMGGNCCPTCDSADFNGDGDTGTDLDIEAFFRVLGGGSC